MKKKIMAEEGSFRLENIKRRSRYTLVFSLLAAALFAMLVININSGNVHIPIDNIIKIIFTHIGSEKEDYYGSTSRRRLISVRFFTSNLL